MADMFLAPLDHKLSYDAEVREAARRHGVDEDWAAAVHKYEYNPKQWVSSGGARGPMQLIPSTARDLGVDPDDPMQNIDGGVRYLKQMQQRAGGNLRLATQMYNAGPGAPQNADMAYVDRVMSRTSNPYQPTAMPQVKDTGDFATDLAAHMTAGGLKPIQWSKKLPEFNFTRPDLNKEGERKGLQFDTYLGPLEEPQVAPPPPEIEPASGLARLGYGVGAGLYGGLASINKPFSQLAKLMGGSEDPNSPNYSMLASAEKAAADKAAEYEKRANLGPWEGLIPRTVGGFIPGAVDWVGNVPFAAFKGGMEGATKEGGGLLEAGKGAAIEAAKRFGMGKMFHAISPAMREAPEIGIPGKTGMAVGPLTQEGMATRAQAIAGAAGPAARYAGQVAGGGAIGAVGALAEGETDPQKIAQSAATMALLRAIGGYQDPFTRGANPEQVRKDTTALDQEDALRRANQPPEGIPGNSITTPLLPPPPRFTPEGYVDPAANRDLSDVKAPAPPNLNITPVAGESPADRISRLAQEANERRRQKLAEADAKKQEIITKFDGKEYPTINGANNASGYLQGAYGLRFNVSEEEGKIVLRHVGEKTEEVPVEKPPAQSGFKFEDVYTRGSKVEYIIPGTMDKKMTGEVVGYKTDPVTGDTFAIVKEPTGRIEYVGLTNDIRLIKPPAEMTPEELRKQVITEDGKTQEQVDNDFVSQMRAELEARKASETPLRSEPEQRAEEVPPSETIVPETEAKPDETIPKTPDAETQRVDEILKKHSVQDLLDFLSGKREIELPPSPETEAKAAEELAAQEVVHEPIREMNPKRARDLARQKTEETGIPWKYEEQLDGSFKIEPTKPSGEADPEGSGSTDWMTGGSAASMRSILKSERGSISTEDFQRLYKEVGNIKDSLLRMLNSPDNIGRKIYDRGVELSKRVTTKSWRGQLDAIHAAEDIRKEMSIKERNMAYAAIEGTMPGNFKPSAAAQKWYAKTRDVFKYYENEFQKYGRLKNAREDYITRIVLADPDGNELYPFQPFMSRDGSIKTTADLIRKGYKVETDLAVILPQYISWAESKLARLEFMAMLKGMILKDGKPAIRPISLVPPGNIKTREFISIKYGDQLRRWNSVLKYDDPVLTEEMKRLDNEEMFVHKDLFKTVDSMFTDPANASIHMLNKIQGGTRRVLMYNPLFHGWNLASETFNSLGILDTMRTLTGNVPGLESPEAVRNIQRRAVDAGVRLEGLYNVRSLLGSDEYKSVLAEEPFKPADLINNPMEALRHPIRSIGDLNTYIVFDQMLRKAQLAMYAIKEQRYLKALGGDIERAAKAAATDTNNAMGTLQPFSFTRNQRIFLRMLMFARDWNIGTARQIIGAVPYAKEFQNYLPRFLRHEGLDNEQWKALRHEDRMYVLRSVIGAFATANIIQAGFLAANGQQHKWTWENEQGHELDMDTGLRDEFKRPIYMRNMLYRLVDDYYKLYKEGPLAVGRGKMEPIIGTSINLLTNTDALNRPIYGEKAGYEGFYDPESLASMAKHIVSIFPIDDFTGKPDKFQNLLEIAAPFLGTNMRHGIDSDRALSKMLQDYFTYQGKHDRLSKEAMAELQMLRAEGKGDEANEKLKNYLRARTVSAAQFKALARKEHNYIAAKIFDDSGMKKEFVDFLMSLPEAKQKYYVEQLKKIGGGR